MKFVVTGALGHIGSHLVRRLPDFFPGCEIVMVDNMLTQRFPSLFDLPKTGHYRFVEGDVTKMELRPLLTDATAVIQLAAITDATSSFNNSEEVEHVNYTATQCVAEACVSSGVPLVMASSTSVYGTQKSEVDENCTPDELNPQSPYAETKLKEERLVRRMVEEEGMSAVLFRYGTIFGISPGMRFHTAVNKFCWQAVMGIPLTVWKTAYDQKRPYLDLDDCARAIAFAISNKLFDGTLYNVVSTNATVRQVIDHIRQHIPGLQVDFVESQIMNQLSYEVLNTRISEAGFVVERQLEQGIADTIKLLGGANSAHVR